MTLRVFLSFAVVAALSFPAFAETAPCAQSRNNLAYTGYFMSAPQNRRECAMRVENGALVVDGTISNPAMSCPDMIAWKLFLSAIQDEFWKRWAADEEAWPNKQPLAPCGPGVDPNQCCAFGRATNPGYADKNNPAANCPWFPGDHIDTHPAGPARRGALLAKAHVPSFAQSLALRRRMAEPGEDPGRRLRQAMAELVFRNKPMFDYTFAHGLYYQEGVAAVFKRNAANLVTGAPYRLDNTTAALTAIDFPANAVMIKSNWINAKRAAELGVTDDPAQPHIKMTIHSPVTDNNGTILEPGEHWLIALHVSSKDTPNWIWASFEHAGNPGRCDYTGCNDSYGYRSPDTTASGQASNYTKPNTRCDDLLIANWVYDQGSRYAGGAITPALNSVFAALKIGQGTKTGSEPSMSDPAWLSYRLKGSQTGFTDSMGRPTHLGNSVTEGGFVISSSCITCHARASTNAAGTIPLPLGVFVNEANEAGYLQSARGVPVPDWFHQSAQPPALQALQTDFVWGFLAALCVSPTCDTQCPNKPDSCNPAPAKTSIRHKIR